MEEIWKDIVIWKNGIKYDFSGFYQVSNFGNVRSLGFDSRHKGRILKLNTSTNEYYFVNLYKDKKGRPFLVHRLVASAFLPNPNNYPCINHKDCNKQNNVVYLNPDGTVNVNLSNLEWCTKEYNNTYGDRLQTIAEKHSKPVIQYDLNGNLIKEWKSANEIQRELGFCQSHISRCCLGKIKTAYSYRWCYV